MSLTLPHGFLLRSGTATDARAVTELVVAEEAAVRGSSRWTETDTLDWFHGLEQGGELLIVDDGSRAIGVLGLRFGVVAKVDSENRAGAKQLYERAGMRVVAEDLAFAKELG